VERVLKNATAAHRAGRYEEAQGLYAQYVAAVPNDAAGWSQYGSLLRTLKEHDNGLRMHRRAIALRPNSASVVNNLANLLSDIGQYEESIRLRMAILHNKPDDTVQKFMIGRCFRSQGRYAEAISWLKRCLKEHPNDPEIRIQLAFAQLGNGHYRSGFANYEARWNTDEIALPDTGFPRWNGEDLNGKSVLILPEQGFGDFVLMARLLPMLKERGAKVSVQAKKPLLPLLDCLEGCDDLAPAYPKDSSFDYWISLFDLPRLGLDSISDIPAPTTLSIPHDSQNRAKAITAPYKEKFKIGVVWCGSTTYKGNAFRSFSHRDFLPLADIPNVQLFSLYKGPALKAFQKDGSAGLIVDAASGDRHFADCAATMSEMDLIITSDTATAHIAGSLGLPTWVLLHWDAFWVYTHKGDTTPWYPSLRLFRQPEPRDWASVHAAVRSSVIEKLGETSS